MSITHHSPDNSAESISRGHDQIEDSTPFVLSDVPAPTRPSVEHGHERAARRSLRSVLGRRAHHTAKRRSFAIENSAVDFNDYIAGYVRFTPVKRTKVRD